MDQGPARCSSCFDSVEEAAGALACVSSAVGRDMRVDNTDAQHFGPEFADVRPDDEMRDVLAAGTSLPIPPAVPRCVCCPPRPVFAGHLCVEFSFVGFFLSSRRLLCRQPYAAFGQQCVCH